MQNGIMPRGTVKDENKETLANVLQKLADHGHITLPKEEIQKKIIELLPPERKDSLFGSNANVKEHLFDGKKLYRAIRYNPQEFQSIIEILETGDYSLENIKARIDSGDFNEDEITLIRTELDQLYDFHIHPRELKAYEEKKAEAEKLLLKKKIEDLFKKMVELEKQIKALPAEEKNKVSKDMQHLEKEDILLIKFNAIRNELRKLGVPDDVIKQYYILKRIIKNNKTLKKDSE